MTNRQLAAQQTRKKLVAAARRLIGEKGLTNTSVAEIAKEAGVANGTFYTYFRTKEEIVFELGWESFRNLLDETLQQAGGFPERLVYFMVHFAGQIEASGLKLCQEWVRNNADPALVEPQNRGKLQLDLASLGKLVEDGIPWPMSSTDRCFAGLWPAGPTATRRGRRSSAASACRP